MTTLDHTAPTRRVAFALAPARRPGRMELRILDGKGAPRTVALDAPIVTVGRSSVADLRIRERSISSVHFELRATTRGAALRDLGSTNGLWFHERRVPAVELEEGDEFRAGECRFVLTGVSDVDVELIAADKYGRLYGESLAMRELYTDIEKLGPTPLGVLLLGETGTGKELTARTIHEVSGRSGPLVVLDCGALSPTLAEGTIFGFRKGAFTGADREQPGVFEAANGGTLFIDEVGELPLELQVKLLRALDNREVMRLGETAARRVDVRVIAATHRDLREAVAQGDFREDLYYRLADAIMRTPPLRERGDDLIVLAQKFIDDLCSEHGLGVTLGEDAKLALRGHAWPGNVRELRNTLRQAAHRQQRGEIGVAGLRLHDRRLLRRNGVDDLIREGSSYAEVLAAVDSLFLPQLLDKHEHNLTAAAKELGKSRDTLRKRLRELGLHSR